MRSAYLDYAMSVIVGRALPDVRDGLKPVHRRVLFAMNEMGLQPNRPLREVRRIVGDGDGPVPPARRLGDLRHARPHGAGLLAAPPAGRRAGQLRLGRRRSRGRDAVHGGPARAASRARCCATSTPTRSTSSPTTTARTWSRRSCRRASRTCSSTARPASPSAWRRTSRRTTCARSIAATVAFIDNPDIDTAGLMQHLKGPDFPTGGVILGLVGHPRGLRDRPRPGPRPRAAPTPSRSRTARRRSSSPSCRTR